MWKIKHSKIGCHHEGSSGAPHNNLTMRQLSKKCELSQLQRYSMCKANVR